jgi:hypothetical protein
VPCVEREELESSSWSRIKDRLVTDGWMQEKP